MKMNMILAMIGLMVLSTGCSIIDPQERGVRVSMGVASNEVLEPGPQYWIPFISKVKAVPVKIQKIEIEKSEAVSKDSQEMSVHVVVNYQIEPSAVVTVVKEFGSEEIAVDTVLVPAVHEVLKQATAKKALMEVLSKRDELKKEVDESLMERMSKYGIKVRDVSIVNLTFSHEFSKSVERKMVAEQEAKQAEYAAEKAKNEAKALVNTAQGQADAQKLLLSSLTPLILQKLAIEKWKGDVPMVVGGNGAMPFLDLKSLARGKEQ